MGRRKTHTEFADLEGIEYQRAVNRIYSKKCYMKKQIVKLKEKLQNLEKEMKAQVPQVDTN